MINIKKLYLLFLIPLLSLASESEIDPCDVTDGGATAGYLCVGEKIDIADKKLNHSYKIALERIRQEAPEFETSFRTAQRTWLKYKDAQCDFTGKMSTNSPWQGVQIEECKLNMMLKRIDYLNSIYLG